MIILNALIVTLLILTRPRDTGVELPPEPEKSSPDRLISESTVTLTRPRGYFDASRDTMSFNGKALPGVPPTGAGVSSTKLNLAEEGARPITAVFNGERITGRTWPAAGTRVVVLELTY